MNHTRFPKENHPPDSARRDNKVTKGDRAEYVPQSGDQNTFTACPLCLFLDEAHCWRLINTSSVFTLSYSIQIYTKSIP